MGIVLMNIPFSKLAEDKNSWNKNDTVGKKLYDKAWVTVVFAILALISLQNKILQQKNLFIGLCIYELLS